MLYVVSAYILRLRWWDLFVQSAPTQAADADQLGNQHLHIVILPDCMPSGSIVMAWCDVQLCVCEECERCREAPATKPVCSLLKLRFMEHLSLAVSVLYAER